MGLPAESLAIKTAMPPRFQTRIRLQGFGLMGLQWRRAILPASDHDRFCGHWEARILLRIRHDTGKVRASHLRDLGGIKPENAASGPVGMRKRCRGPGRPAEVGIRV